MVNSAGLAEFFIKSDTLSKGGTHTQVRDNKSRLSQNKPTCQNSLPQQAHLKNEDQKTSLSTMQ